MSFAGILKTSLSAFSLIIIGAAICSAQENPTGVLSGTVIDSITGKPISGTWVSVLRVDDDQYLRVDTTDDQGDYEIPDLIIGTYMTRTFTDGWLLESLDNCVISQDDTTRLDFHLMRDEAIPEVHWRMPEHSDWQMAARNSGYDISDQDTLGALGGMVLNSDSLRPIWDITITYEVQMNDSFIEVKEGKTNLGGWFWTYALQPGQYRVRIGEQVSEVVWVRRGGRTVIQDFLLHQDLILHY